MDVQRHGKSGRPALEAPPATELQRNVTLAALVASNLLPLVGVFYWGWDVGALVVLYWSENLILGFYTLVKMLSVAPIGGLFSGAFFLIHYGGFCAVHGMFVLTLAVGDDAFVHPQGEAWPLFLVFVQLLVAVVEQVLAMAPPEWLIAFAALFISHGISLLVNFFARGERLGMTVGALMTAPYKRIVILHVAIIFGGFAVMALGSPLALLLLLVVLKLGLDVVLHLREHRAGAAADDAAGVDSPEPRISRGSATGSRRRSA